MIQIVILKPAKKIVENLFLTISGFCGFFHYLYNSNPKCFNFKHK